MSNLDYKIVLLDDDGHICEDGHHTGILIDNCLAKIEEVYFEDGEENLVVDYKLSSEYDYPEDMNMFKSNLTLAMANLMAALADDLKDDNADD